MTSSARCPALLVAAPASGQGKTTITAALARRYRDRGLRVRVFKCGPDFLDPMILERASGHPVLSLDLFMVGEDDCRRLLYEAACEADIILVEGVMGLFDGDPSAADIAARFGLPVLAVIMLLAGYQLYDGQVSHLDHRDYPGLCNCQVVGEDVGDAQLQAGEGHRRQQGHR